MHSRLRADGGGGGGLGARSYERRLRASQFRFTLEEKVRQAARGVDPVGALTLVRDFGRYKT